MEENKEARDLEEGKDTKEEKDDVFMEEEVEDTKSTEDKERTKVQNMMAAAIVLAGLFVGSLYVDIAQLVRGEGVSLKKLDKVDVFSANGKTWVSSNDPIVNLTVINDDTCEKCDVEPVLAAIKKTALPTLTTKKVDASSPEGQKLLSDHGLKAIPAFIFDSKLKDAEFFEQAKQIFKEENGVFVLDNEKAGVPMGKYVVLPEFKSAAPSLGSDDAKVAVIIFGDFQCPFSKSFHDTFTKVYPKYQDKIKVSFHQFPLVSIHPQAFNGALASLCAGEQNKFWEMQDALFGNQKEWGEKSGDKVTFEKYARNLGINAGQFKQCMTDEKYKDEVAKDQQLAADFQLTGTPSVFVGSQFVNGALTEQKLSEMLDAEVGK